MKFCYLLYRVSFRWKKTSCCSAKQRKLSVKKAISFKHCARNSFKNPEVSPEVLQGFVPNQPSKNQLEIYTRIPLVPLSAILHGSPEIFFKNSFRNFSMIYFRNFSRMSFRNAFRDFLGNFSRIFYLKFSKNFS